MDDRGPHCRRTVPGRTQSVGIALLAGSIWALPAVAAAQATLPALPTPRQHYQTYDLRQAALALAPRVAAELGPAMTQRLVTMARGEGNNGAAALTPSEVKAILESLDLEPLRGELIEMLIHGSSVLDMVPQGYEGWVPIVHDSFLVIMSGMSTDRIRGRIADQLLLPRNASRGARLLAFGAETPLFQKVGQIVARQEWVPDDLGAALVSLESDIVTTDASEVLAIIRAELGEARLRKYRLEFEDKLLSEASVGAVIGATLVLPGERQRRDVVVKVIKAYAIAAIEHDLGSITRLLGMLEENAAFYGIGEAPLLDMFREVRRALAQEIQAADERAHLAAAAAYFAADDRVLIPSLCPCSTANVTLMERMPGGKVTDAYAGDAQRRHGLAQRLADVMMYEVLFRPGESLFHGDPHAGNVFASPSDADPYRISLLDWGLQGHLSVEQKRKLIQIGFGLRLRHADRLRDNMDILVVGSIDPVADRDRADAIIENVFEAAELREHDGDDAGALAMLDDLVSELATAGFVVDADVLLYVKSLLTLSAVITDLDADFVAGDYVEGRFKRQVLKELPKRLLNTIWIPGMWSHDYPSMTSNNDVWATQVNSLGLGLKAVGVGIWKGISFPFRDRDEAGTER